MDKEKENVLIYKEKPYFTDEELILYYKVIIDEAEKEGYEEIANHYKILLYYLTNQKKDENAWNNFLSNNNRK